jgi:metallo-beta-lactamase family protein
LGAARTVTGSFFVMECGTTRFAIDCGLFQGSKEIRERNYQDFPVNPRSLDFLILTHAHIDHSGLIPKLVHRGFSGPIYCTYPTADLASIMLPDSGHIQEMEVEQKNRRAMRSGRPLLEPIYTVEQAQRSLERLRPVNYDEMVQAAPNVRFRLRDAGHILGSAFVELWGTEDEVTSKIVFSGDVGNLNLPIIKDPTAIESADFLLLESTYGNRYHERAEQRAQLMRDTIKFTLAKGGNLIIPSFAVERTQDLLFDLCQLRRQGQLPEDVPVYIDSPLAIAATEVFRKNLPYWDDQTRQLVEAGHSPFDLPNLRFARTAEESRRLNEINGRTIIISASGMCDAGRIKHHLKHNLWRPEATILFVGYQAEGTLGRRLLEGEKLVRIHGEEPALNALADAIRSELHIPVHVPFWMEEVDLRLRKPPIQEMPVFEGDVQQALKAEHMYLQLRLKLNEEFQRSWRQQDYARLIEYLQEAGAALEQKTRGETGQEPR